MVMGRQTRGQDPKRDVPRPDTAAVAVAATMLLSSILEASEGCCSDDACCELFADGEHDTNDDHDDDDDVSTSRQEPSCSSSRNHDDDRPYTRGASSFLTYQGALQAQTEHAKWLQHLVESSLSSSSGCKKDVPHMPASPLRVHHVYVVYISSNNVDLLLSVMACSSLSLPCRWTGRSDSAVTTIVVTAIPTLLNTRWTTAEMVRALGPKAGAVIAVVYSMEHEAQAQEVASKLERGTKEFSMGLRACCAPLPTFSRRFFQPRTVVAPSRTSRTSPFPTDAAVWKEIDRVVAQQHQQGDGNERSRPVDGDAVILFTSGTSSSKGARGVRLSHRALRVQALAKLLPPVHYLSQTVLLATTVPFYHVGGLSSAIAVWMAGGSLVLPASSSTTTPFSFDPYQVFRSLRIANVNTLVVVPAMLHALLTAHQKGKEERYRATGTTVQYPTVRCVLIGGQSAPQSSLQFCRTAFPNAALVQTYACTEAASSLTFRDVTVEDDSTMSDVSSHASSSAFIGDCVGTAPSHVELAVHPVVNNDDRSATTDVAATAAGVGVIATRGPHVMNGYWDVEGGPSTQSIASGSTSSPQQLKWHVTGDLGRIDAHGRLWFCGRVADSIRTGGETVMAGEVERVLQKHPHIEDVAVFAIPDDKFGHAVACAVVLQRSDGSRFGDTTTETDIVSVRTIREWCAQNGLAGYKRPRHVFVVPELPKNSSGKTLKYLLVDRFSNTGSSVPQSKL